MKIILAIVVLSGIVAMLWAYGRIVKKCYDEDNRTRGFPPKK